MATLLFYVMCTLLRLLLDFFFFLNLLYFYFSYYKEVFFNGFVFFCGCNFCFEIVLSFFLMFFNLCQNICELLLLSLAKFNV